jgi:hypothetical protein
MNHICYYCRLGIYKNKTYYYYMDNIYCSQICRFYMITKDNNKLSYLSNLRPNNKI